MCAHHQDILVVDDSATNRRLLRSVAETLGFSVRECESGKHCIELCLSQAPELVLLDVMMPEMDGITTIHKLREHFSKEELPVVLVTNKSDSSDVAHGLSAGANDYVTKPIDREVLLARLTHQLSLKQARKVLLNQNAALAEALAIQSALGDVLEDALIIHDPHGEVVYANSRVRVGHQAGSNSEKLDALIRTSWGEHLFAQLWPEIQAVVNSPELTLRKEIKISKGQFRNVLAISKPLTLQRDKPGQEMPLRFLLLRDLTAIRELAATVNQRVKLETVSLFAMGVAHNFNNAFGAILGASELLKKICKEEPRAQRCLTVIDKALEGGVALTRKLSAIVIRDTSASGQSRVALEPTLRMLMERACQGKDGRIQWDLSFPQETPKLSIGFPNLEEAILSVFTNAVDAIEEKGTIRVEISFKSDTQMWLITVTDTGHGMEEEVLSHVFEPFFSTKNVERASGVSIKGNGLGLWNTYSVVKTLGGEVSISSKKGKGTEVCLSLPREVLEG